MPTKLQMYSELAVHSAQRMTQSREQWTSFLETASRLYKYPFNEQLMIFTQRPDAKACAPLEIWNEPMNRWVKRGSRGIALIDTTGDKPRLKYVFDVSDTEAARRELSNSSRPRRPFLWELQEEHQAPVMDALAKAYDSDAQGDLGSIIYEVAGRLASEYFDDHRQDILYSVEGSYLEDFDEYNIQVAYRSAVTVSVAYSLMSRCGIDTGAYLENEDFMPVFDFNTPDAINALGTGVSEINEQVLREIEITIKNYERQKAAERSNSHGQLDIFQERGLSHSRPGISGADGRTDRQIRSDASELPQRPQSNIVQLYGNERNPVPTPDRDQQDSGATAGSVDAGADTAEPAPRQSQQSDGMGTAHEQPETPSRGIGTRGADLQLTPAPSMDNTSLNSLLLNSKLETLDIDNVLRAASNQTNCDQRIFLKYAHDMPPDNIAAFLQAEYRTGGRGIQNGTKEVSAWWDKDGLLIGAGKSALQANDRVFLSWQQVEARTRHLVQSGAFLSTERVENAADNEQKRLASQLVFTYRDDMRGIREMPEEWEENGRGFPDMESKVASLLSNPESLDKIVTTLQADNAELKNRANERVWHINDVDNLLSELQQWQRPLVTLENEPLPVVGFQFITDDEVDAFLSRRSSFSNGKARIIHHFLNEHTLKESVDFLKQEYGTGGSTAALSRADDSYEDHSAKGLTLSRGRIGNPYAKVDMNWNTVAKRIDMLINEGRFFTRSELNDFRESYTKHLIASNISSFYYNVSNNLIPDGADKSFIEQLDYSARIKQLETLLDDPAQLESIVSTMETVFSQMDESYRDYEDRAESLKLVQAYKNGTLDLIPQLSTVPIPDTIMSTSTVVGAPIPVPVPQIENEQLRLGLFPTEAAQREIVAIAEGLKPSAFSITDEEIDALLINALENPEVRQRVVSQYETNPRSREATAILKDSYSSLAFTMPRTDGEAGYIGLLGEGKGVALSKGDALIGPIAERQPVDTVTLPWPKLQRRITQLVENGAFIGNDHTPVVVEDVSPEIESVQLEQATPQLPRSIYEVGDTVYLENNKPFVIMTVGSEIRLTDPEIQPPRLPVHRTENREAFERLLYRNPQNNAYTDYMHGELASVNPVMGEIITDALLSPEQKAYVGNMIAEGKTNTEIADYCARSFRYKNEDYTLADNTTAKYSWHERGLIVSHDKGTRLTESWGQVAAIFRSQYARGIDGFELKAPEQAAVAAEPDFDVVSKIVLERVMQDGDYLPALAEAKSRASLRNPCAWAVEASVRDHETDEPAIFHKYFSDMDWRDKLLTSVLRDSYANRSQQEQAVQPEREQAQRPETEYQDNAPTVEAETAAIIKETPSKPQPVFFVNWEEAQHDFDLSRYSDRDVVGYDKDGVQYAVGKSGNLTYITSTGMLWGGNSVPGNIYEQIHAYADGELTAEQVRENYLKIISPETVQTSHAVEQNEEANFEEQIRLELDGRGFAVSDELIENGLPDYRAHGGSGDIQDIADFIENDFLLEYELAYRYVNDRLIVYNEKDYDPDDLPDIVARIEPDGSIVFVDENLPDAARREIERVAVDDLEMYKEDAEAILQQMLDMAAAVAAADNAGERQTPAPIVATAQNRINFQITDDNLGYGGAKTKYQMNIEAIRTLKAVEAESRLATPEEQETLSKYVGWGGLPQAFDSENDKWTKEYAELKELLSPYEYDKARASTLNAHYTSPTVIKAMYDAVERMGFKSGNILEPACGIGNFFGLLPESMADSKLYGVELDSITGRIAQQLYQKSDILITGFEKTGTPDALFDLAIGNVPFGNYKIPDKRYDKNNFAIHDYFFAKALDQVRPGGVVAFITTSGTLDKNNSNVRKYIAQRAELLGAVRLPNDAFLKNAGTEVTTDIIFLQKRDRLLDIQPDWVHLGVTKDGVPVNSYFAEHPEMILGKMVFDESMYGDTKDTACHPMEGADLAAQLQEAIGNIHGQITEMEYEDTDAPKDVSIPADPNVRNYSYTIIDDTVYFRENSRMYPAEMPAVTLERVKGMVELRDCVHTLIEYQLDEYGDQAIAEKQSELNRLYDTFTKKNGLINSSANGKAFASDSAYYLLCSLEILDENGELDRKADMFNKRTIKQKTVVTSVDTASEALTVSIAERARIDLDFMQSLTGFSEEALLENLHGAVYADYSFDVYSNNIKHCQVNGCSYRTADDFLSGNVREKLQHYKAALEVLPADSPYRQVFSDNAKALEAVQPKDLDASEISVRLGTTWIDKDYINQFVHELLQPPSYLAEDIKVNYFPYTGEWNVAAQRRVPGSNVLANVTFGTGRMNAYRIIEDTLNLKDVRVYDTIVEDGKEKRVLNKKETTLAQQKQESIKQVFQDWIFKDPNRRRDLVQTYNERFNSTRPREYDGSHINFAGISPEITLRTHQLNAIAHILYGGNTLLAHEVGAGKTFEMVASAMELKRLGLAQKSLFAVPNHLTEQWASEFLRLYPSANILVATAKDFEMKNRKKFCAKIATGDYDAVIIGHSQLEKIPLSKERQERLLNEQIGEITEGIDELKRNDGERFSIKQLEKTKKSLEARLERLTDDSRKDDVVTFEQLGVDRLFVDEAHSFKNLFLYTKMRNVAGLSQTEAQKSSDLFGKCRYLDELTDNKGVIFATGTPISNSMAEMYTMQRYLQYENLKKNGLTHFDCWASTFGETTTAIELAPEGTGYRARTRFAKFHNLPELMCMFKEVADIKTADMMDLPRPNANYKTIVVKPSEIQTEMVKDLSKRAADVHRGSVDPTIDNMLKITSDGRKIGLDQRLINDMLPDDEGSKVNACMNEVYQIWNDTKADKLTQLVFCDFSTPNADGRFNVYDDIRDKLLQKGIPEDEIAFIHCANTEVRKKELFAKVRQGKVRVLLGSTFKMGSGTNVQDRLIHLHDLDCPWRPSDLEQHYPN